MTTPLGLGGSGIGNHRVDLDDADAARILREAWDVGVRRFDTAPHYGLGLSERRLGDHLATVPRDTAVVSTKVGRRLVPKPVTEGALDVGGFRVPATHDRVWDFSEAGVRTSVEESLGRLRCDHLDVAYVHDPERTDLEVSLGTALSALERLREEGLVRRIGVGSMDRDALLVAARSGRVDELMVANRHTLLDQGSVAELLPTCLERGVDVVAAAVFNGGLLADGAAVETYDYEQAPADVVRRLGELRALCERHDVPLAALALQYPLRHPAVVSVVVGVVAPGQVTRNAELLATEVPDALWASVEPRAGAVA